MEKKKFKIIFTLLAFFPLIFTNYSWAEESYNLKLKEANCKCGATVTCYGSSCERGESLCIQNPCNCPKCNEQ